MTKYTKDKEWVKYESYLKNEGLTERRIKKLKMMFGMVKRFNKGTIDKMTRSDIEQFLDKINNGSYTKIDGERFSGSTKADIKKFLKQYFKHIKGNDEFYPKEVSWIKARIGKDEKPKEKPILGIEEVQKLANMFDKNEYRILTLVLFDCGFRISEALSSKKRDLTWEDYDGVQKCFWIFCNESKTFKRKVPIPLFTEDIKNFVNSSYYRSKGNDDPLFDVTYNSYRTRLEINSKKMLGKIISPHALRHSSATYYSKEFEGNMNLISQRYGWSFSSDEMKTYIRQSGAYQKIGVKKVYNNEILKLKEEMDLMKEQLKTIQKQLEISRKYKMIKKSS